MNNFAQLMQNPKSIAIRKFMHQILENKMSPYDELITRISYNLVTENDFKLFGDMMNDVLAVGYHKAIKDYQKQLNDLGLQVKLG